MDKSPQYQKGVTSRKSALQPLRKKKKEREKNIKHESFKDSIKEKTGRGNGNRKKKKDNSASSKLKKTAGPTGQKGHRSRGGENQKSRKKGRRNKEKGIQTPSSAAKGKGVTEKTRVGMQRDKKKKPCNYKV